MRATGPPRTFLVLLIALLALATPVWARGFPPFPNVTAPAIIHLVASDGAAPSRAFGEFEVVVRDLANNPLPGVSVRVDVTLAEELRIASDQHDPAAVVDCADKAVTKLTDVNGRAVFCILGSNVPGAPASTLISGGRIFANGLLCAAPTASAFDLDGTLGLGSGDLSVFLSDFASGQPFGRSDFDGSGSLGAGDLSIWLKAFASGTQVVSAAACP